MIQPQQCYAHSGSELSWWGMGQWCRAHGVPHFRDAAGPAISVDDSGAHRIELARPPG